MTAPARTAYVPREWDPKLESVRDGMARTLWLSVYADAAEREHEDEDRDDADEDRPLPPMAGPREDWDDVAPRVGPPTGHRGSPLQCVHAADDVIASMAADYPGDFAEDCDEWATWAERRRHHCPLEKLGHCIALQVLGCGVSLEDELPSNHWDREYARRLRKAADRASRATGLEFNLTASWCAHECEMFAEYSPRK